LAATNSPYGCSLYLTRFWKNALSNLASKPVFSLRKFASADSDIPKTGVGPPAPTGKVISAKPENGTSTILSRITPLHAAVAYSIFLRICPATNNFPLVTRKKSVLSIRANVTGTSLT